MADLLTAGQPRDIALTDITKNTMRAAFAAYASAYEPASIRRCWSTWNVLCEFTCTAELIPANPMAFVGRPKAAKTLPRSLPQPAVGALLEAGVRVVSNGAGRPAAEKCGQPGSPPAPCFQAHDTTTKVTLGCDTSRAKA